jgi:hypothetical protein
LNRSRGSILLARSLFVSLIIHGVVLIFLLFPGASTSNTPRNQGRPIASIIREAIGSSISGGGLSSVVDAAESHTYDFSPGMGDEQKAAIVKALINRMADYIRKNPNARPGEISLKNLLSSSEMAGGLELDSGGRAFVSGLHGGDPAVHIDSATPSEMKALEQSTSNEDVERHLVTRNRGLVHVDIKGGGYGDSWLNKRAYPGIPEQYYFRESPYGRILASMPNLFTCFTGFPLLSGSRANDREDSRKREERRHASSLPSDRLNVIFVSLGTHRPKPERAAKSVFGMNGPERQKILDDLMPLSEGGQYLKLKKEYLYRYDANCPALADLADEFFEKNLNNVFFDVNPISTAFDKLETLYFQKGIYDDLAHYWNENAGTLTGGTALIYLAASYDFEKSTIVELTAAYSAAKDMYLKGYVPNNIFNSRRKAMVVKLGFEKIKNAGTPFGGGRMEAVIARYDEARLRIFSLLIESGGANGDRGRFAMGKFLWDRGDLDQAMEQWNKITNSYEGGGFLIIRRILKENLNRSSKIERIKKAFISFEMENDEEKQVERLVRYSRWKVRLENQERSLN